LPAGRPFEGDPAATVSQGWESELQRAHGHAPVETTLQAQPGFAGTHPRRDERIKPQRPRLRSDLESLAHDRRSRRQDRYRTPARQRSDTGSHLRPDALGLDALVLD